MSQRTWTRVTTTSLLLGGAHALTDAGCGFLVAYYLKSGEFERSAVVFLILLYNTLAFAGQAPVGWLIDRLGTYRRASIAGVLLVAQGLVVCPGWALGAVVLAGVGNALFHVGAGALVLNGSENRATESGVFVGPGAAGLCVGLCLGAWRVPAHYVLAVLLLLAAPYLWRVARPLLAVRSELPQVQSRWIAPVLLCVCFLLGSVTIRALVGFTISGAWRGVSQEVLIALALAACLGKMAGGFVSDRMGWATTSVAALALSAPLVSALVGVPAGAVLGMLVFQMTMAVTLKAMHHVLPDRPGLAFGLPCLAIWIGVVPKMLGVFYLFKPWPVVLATTLVSLVCVAAGLKLLVRIGAAPGPGHERIGWFERA